MANEKRLIDANKFEKLVLNHRSDYLFKEDVIAALAKQPTVDAVEVVHGRWEPHHMVPGFVRCSACRDCITYDEWPDGQKWKYCPNCGAKMDK